LLAAAVAGLGLMLARSARARYRADLQAAASALGLRVLEGAEALEAAAGQVRVPASLQRLLARVAGPRIDGTYRGVRVAVYTESRSSSKGNHTETVFEAHYVRPLAFDLHMAREGVGAKIAKAFGGGDVEVGDAALDAAFRIRTDNPDLARALFRSPAVRKAALDAVAACPALRASRTHVRFERSGKVRRTDQIAAVLDAIAPLARAMSGT
jgi:hypothetical protein